MANTAWSATDKQAGITLSGSNLIATCTAAGGVRTVDKQAGGKFYWEVTATTFANFNSSIGLASSVASLTGLNTIGTCGLVRAGVLTVDGSNAVTGFGTVANGTVICFAADVSNRLIWVRLGAAGNWNNNAANSPASGVGGAAITLGIGIPALPAFYGGAASEAVTANFGGSAFTGVVPAGFTSGFTAGAVIGTNEVVSQIAAEHWASTIPPQAWASQVALEHWVTTNVTNPQMAATLVALEHWASVAVASSAAQARAAILA